MKLIINVSDNDSKDVYFIVENEQVHSKEDLQALKDKIRFSAVNALCTIMSSKYVTSRVVIDLDNIKSYNMTLKGLPDREVPLQLDSTYAYNRISIHLINFQSTYKFTLSGLRTLITTYVPSHSFDFVIKDSSIFGLNIDNTTSVNIINSKLYETLCIKTNYHLNVSDNSYVEMFTDIPFCTTGERKADVTLIYIPSNITQDSGEERAIAYKVAARMSSMGITKTSKVLLISGAVEGFVNNSSTLELKDDSCDVQIYLKPIGIVTRVNKKGVYNTTSFDVLNLSNGKQGSVYKFPADWLYLDKLDTSSNYDKPVDITKLLFKIVKEQSQPVL